MWEQWEEGKGPELGPRPLGSLGKAAGHNRQTLSMVLRQMSRVTGHGDSKNPNTPFSLGKEGDKTLQLK